MPTTNPYSYDTTVANINKGSPDNNQTNGNSYLTFNPVPPSPSSQPPPTQAPPSFGGAGSSLATNNEFSSSSTPSWGNPGIVRPPPAATPPPSLYTGTGTYQPGTNNPLMQVASTPPAVNNNFIRVTDPSGNNLPTGPSIPWNPVTQPPTPAGWQPPPAGTIDGTLGLPSPSPTPPPGNPPGPPGTTWVADGHGNYGWGKATPQYPTTGDPWTAPIVTTPGGDLHLHGPYTPPPPWSQSLNGGYQEAAFTNPGGGTIPTQQQWANYSPVEQQAVADLNKSVNGMSIDDLRNYLAKSAPQWSSAGPAVYKSF